MKSVQEVEQLLQTGKKLTPTEGMELARKYMSQGLIVDLIIKVNNTHFGLWYKYRRPQDWPETLDEETTYITSNDNKAFESGMGGYSIFARSLAAMKRRARDLIVFSEVIERIEHMPMEWIIVDHNSQRKVDDVKR